MHNHNRRKRHIVEQSKQEVPATDGEDLLYALLFFAVDVGGSLRVVCSTLGIFWGVKNWLYIGISFVYTVYKIEQFLTNLNKREGVGV